MDKTQTTSFRLSPLARKLLVEISEALGVSRTAVVELAIRVFVEEKMKTSELKQGERVMLNYDNIIGIRNRELHQTVGEETGTVTDFRLGWGRVQWDGGHISHGTPSQFTKVD